MTKVNKKFIFLLIIAHCSLLITDCCSQWIIQNSGTSEHLYDIYFINTQTGWACGSNGTIIKTTNSGNNWFVQNSGINDRPLNSIHFVNDNTGWSCTSLFSIAGVIIKTTNGGNSWFTQYSTPDKSFFSLYFIDTSRGWVASSGTGGEVLKTTDGGNNWDSLSLVPGGAAGRDIEFVNPQTGWVAMGSKIFKSTDGGLSWFLQFDNIGNGEIQSLSFLNIITGYAVSLASWRVYKTTNSGDNWVLITTLPNCANAHCIFFSNVNTGWVSGDCGWMFSTTNGGLNWQQQQTNTNSFLQSVQFVTDSVGWAVGGAGRIIHTDSMGQVQPVKNISTEIPKKFELYQNYPNPFNNQTIIRFSVIEKDNYRLEIYDLIGRRVDEILNNELRAGTYEVEYNSTELSSGIYLYKLSGTKDFAIKKLVLIK